jgi:hypothetical protein
MGDQCEAVQLHASNREDTTTADMPVKLAVSSDPQVRLVTDGEDRICGGEGEVGTHTKFDGPTPITSRGTPNTLFLILRQGQSQNRTDGCLSDVLSCDSLPMKLQHRSRPTSCKQSQSSNSPGGFGGTRAKPGRKRPKSAC